MINNYKIISTLKIEHIKYLIKIKFLYKNLDISLNICKNKNYSSLCKKLQKLTTYDLVTIAKNLTTEEIEELNYIYDKLKKLESFK